jgi:hypothetical protein
MLYREQQRKVSYCIPDCADASKNALPHGFVVHSTSTPSERLVPCAGYRAPTTTSPGGKVNHGTQEPRSSTHNKFQKVLLVGAVQEVEALQAGDTVETSCSRLLKITNGGVRVRTSQQRILRCMLSPMC